MIFKRYSRNELFLADRLVALYERQAAPLSMEAERQCRRDMFDRVKTFHRNLEADLWKKGRRDFYALSDIQRATFRAIWRAFSGPKTATCFCDLILDYQRGIGLTPVPDFACA